MNNEQIIQIIEGATVDELLNKIVRPDYGIIIILEWYLRMPISDSISRV